ncbi:MAG TPA: hypothetical protein VFH89_07330 [Sphingomicrobium sp.]|nr:hypothetical protein [Sphingomicrobium sp.]
MRVGFLFNHDQIHQVAHSLPIAIALSRLSPAFEVVIATTNELLRQEVNRLLSLYPDPFPLEMARLQSRRALVGTAIKALNGVIPAAKIAIYRDNLDFFRSLDALVVAEKTSAILKTRYGLENLKLIHTRHGAGDRAVGFNKTSAAFDFVLVAGPKIRERLASEAGVAPERMAIVGYPKFDLPRKPELPVKLRGNGRSTVLYNPHVSPHLSSWYRHGRSVLDFFLANPDYNLIFAPHVMLFERKIVLSIDKMRVSFPGILDPKYACAQNIHVDLASSASTDMTYTESADIYLGDASSQVYEFLIRPRPCLFLNSRGADYAGDPNFAHWSAGRVIDDPSQMKGALASAFVDHRRFGTVQKDLFTRSIALEETPSSTRAAIAVSRFLMGGDLATSGRVSADHAVNGAQAA